MACYGETKCCVHQTSSWQEEETPGTASGSAFQQEHQAASASCETKLFANYIAVNVYFFEFRRQETQYVNFFG